MQEIICIELIHLNCHEYVLFCGGFPLLGQLKPGLLLRCTAIAGYNALVSSDNHLKQMLDYRQARNLLLILAWSTVGKEQTLLAIFPMHIS